METTYKVTVKKYNSLGRTSFVGRVTWYDNGHKTWSESTGIHRLNKFDPIKDSHKMATDRLRDSFTLRELKDNFTLNDRLSWPPELFHAVNNA